VINYFEEIEKLNVNRNASIVSVHKPLLLLLTISEIIKGRSNYFLYDDIETRLSGLLKQFSIRVTTSVKPQYPFLYLASNANLWLCSVDKANLKSPDSASRGELKGAVGMFPREFSEFLQADSNGLKIINFILENYWPANQHAIILSDLGLSESQPLDYVHLTVRAKNIIEKLGGITATLNYFKEFGTFIRVPKSGQKTNIELCEFCETILNVTADDLSGVEIQTSAGNKMPINLYECIDYYCINRNLLPARVLNFLKESEDVADFELSIENKIDFVVSRFLNDFQFMNIKKLGAKTVTILNEFALQLKLLARYNEDDCLVQIEPDNLIADLNRKLSYKISKAALENVVINNDYFIFSQLLILVVHQELKSSKYAIAFDLLFRSLDEPNLDLMADKLSCTRERVRQIIVKWENELLPNFIDSLFKKVGDLQSNLDFFANESIVILDFGELSDEKYIQINGNFKFISSVYTRLLNESHMNINNLILEKNNAFKSFEPFTYPLFLSNEYILKSNFLAFIKWIDIELFNFEVAEFEYDLGVLVRRYYKENHIDVNDEIIKILVAILNKICRKDWSDFYQSKAKTKRIQRKEEIFNLLTDFISSKNHPQRSDALVEHLNHNYIEISKIQMLALLNRSQSNINRVGNGLWTISELSNGASGSLREIVAKKLLEYDDPLHISQLLNYIETIRPISERSLLTNLKTDDDKRFIFFNCSFIGLSNRKYDETWKALKRFNGNILSKTYLKAYHLNTVEEAASHYFQVYGYPEIHSKYVLKEIEMPN
jgi:hypothetical protein